MNSDKQIGRIVGILFLLILIIGIFGSGMRGLSSTLVESQTFLKDVFESSMQMKIAIVLDLIASGIGVGIAVTLFTLLSKHNKSIAFLYFGFWIAQFATIIVSNISHFSLISLSEKYLQMGSPDSAYFQTLGFLKVEEYIWAHFISLIIFNVAASMLYFLFYQAKLIPRLLSVLGIIAANLALIGVLIQVFGFNGSMLFFLPNGLFILAFAIWLIVKGFNSSQIVPEPG